MININKNHFKQLIKNQSRQLNDTKFLCEDIVCIQQDFSEIFTVSLYQNAIDFNTDNLFSYWSNSLILEVPRVHSNYILTRAAEAHQMVLRMQRHAGNEVKVTSLEHELILRPGEYKHLTVKFYLTGLCLNTLLGYTEAEQEILDFAFSDFKNAMTSPVPDVCEAFFDLFKAYFANEQDQCVRDALMDNVYPYLQMGAIEAKSEQFVERYYQFLFMPLYSIVAHSWGYDDTDLDTTIKAAMEANYEYHAYFAPQPGQKKGDESLDLFGAEAYIHHHIMAFLAVHYRHTGKMVSFQSDYIPQWVVKGEGPTRDEVLANPPVFDLDHVLDNA